MNIDIVEIRVQHVMLQATAPWLDFATGRGVQREEGKNVGII